MTTRDVPSTSPAWSQKRMKKNVQTIFWKNIFEKKNTGGGHTPPHAEDFTPIPGRGIPPAHPFPPAQAGGLPHQKWHLVAASGTTGPPPPGGQTKWKHYLPSHYSVWAVITDKHQRTCFSITEISNCKFMFNHQPPWVMCSTRASNEHLSFTVYEAIIL